MSEKKLDCVFAMKAVDEAGVFSGYASVFDVVDNQNDRIRKGAFGRSLRERGMDVRLLWQHKTDEPIGVFTDIKEDSHGLYVKGALLLEVQRAQEAYALLRSGAMNGMSIGYSVRRAEYDDVTGVRNILDVDLFEVSLVTFPANEAATVLSVKDAKPKTLREFERFLRENGFTRAEAKEMALYGFRAEEVAALDGAVRRALGVLSD